MDTVFSIRLNKEGIAVARVIVRVFTILSVLTFAGLALVVIREVHVYKVYMRMADGMELQHGFWAGIMFRFVPVGFFLVTAVNIVASYFVLKFARQLGYSLRTLDEQRFSNSFRNLAIAGIFWLFATILQLAISSVLLINQVKNNL